MDDAGHRSLQLVFPFDGEGPDKRNTHTKDEDDKAPCDWSVCFCQKIMRAMRRLCHLVIKTIVPDLDRSKRDLIVHVPLRD